MFCSLFDLKVIQGSLYLIYFRFFITNESRGSTVLQYAENCQRQKVSIYVRAKNIICEDPCALNWSALRYQVDFKVIQGSLYLIYFRFFITNESRGSIVLQYAENCQRQKVSIYVRAKYIICEDACALNWSALRYRVDFKVIQGSLYLIYFRFFITNESRGSIVLQYAENCQRQKVSIYVRAKNIICEDACALNWSALRYRVDVKVIRVRFTNFTFGLNN